MKREMTPLRGVRDDAPQGYLFRFAPLRGHRPLRTSNEGAAGQRLSLRHDEAVTPQLAQGRQGIPRLRARERELRIATTSLRTGLGMTLFMIDKRSVIAKPVRTLAVAIRTPLLQNFINSPDSRRTWRSSR